MPAPNKLRYPQVAGRLFDTPLLVHHAKLLTILRALGPRLGFDVEGTAGPSPAMMEDDDFVPRDPFAHMEYLQAAAMAAGIELESRPEGHFVGEGVAVIPITGTLVQRSDWMSDTSGMMSYGRIERMLLAAENDNQVRELLFEFDTPGGEVAGVFDFSDRVHDYRAQGGKPMTAVVNEMAASAGYLLASAVGNISITRTGGAGSIGVVGAHMDYSKAMDKRGVAITFVYAGDKKIDGNPYQPLPPAVKAEWQAEINTIYDLFAETVARNTGLSVQKVKGTQAGMFNGSAAVDMGLASRVNTFANELSNAVNRAKQARSGGFYTSMSKAESSEKWKALGIRAETVDQWLADTAQADTEQLSNETEKETSMSTKAELEAKEKAEAEAKAKVEAETKAKAEAEAKAKAEANAGAETDKIAAAVKADRERCKAIAELPEAKGREKLAASLADKGMSVDEAKELLAAAPKSTGLDTLMEGHKPGISAEEVTAAAAKPVASVGDIYAHRQKIFQSAAPANPAATRH